MFVLKGILRAESQEKILLYLLARESGYGKAIAEFFSLCFTDSDRKHSFILSYFLFILLVVKSERYG